MFVGVATNITIDDDVFTFTNASANELNNSSNTSEVNTNQNTHEHQHNTNIQAAKKIIIPFTWGIKLDEVNNKCDYETAKNGNYHTSVMTDGYNNSVDVYSPDRTIMLNVARSHIYQYGRNASFEGIKLDYWSGQALYAAAISETYNIALIINNKSRENTLYMFDKMHNLLWKNTVFDGNLVFSRDGRYILSGNELRNVSSGDLVKKLESLNNVNGEVFTPDGEFILINSSANSKNRVGYDNSILAVNINTDTLADVNIGRIDKNKQSDLGYLQINKNSNKVDTLYFLKGTNVLYVKLLQNSWDKPRDSHMCFKYSSNSIDGAQYNELKDNVKLHIKLKSNKSKLSNIYLNNKNKLITEKVVPLRAPRSEFEKTLEYNMRLEKAKILEDNIESEYKQKLGDAYLKVDSELDQLENILKNKLYKITLDIDLDNYNADGEIYEDNILAGKIISIPVPRDAALNQKNSKFKVEGKIRYFDDYSVELVNAFLIDTTNHNSFVFGVQLDPLMVASSEKVPPQLDISSIMLIEQSGTGYLNAGINAKIKVILKNSGKGTAFGVNVNLDPVNLLPAGVTIEKQKFVGIVNSGEEKIIEVDISSSEDIATADVKLRVTATETNGFDAKPIILAFKSKMLDPPQLQLASIEIKSADGKRVISKGVQADITVKVQNIGEGVAKSVILSFMTDSKDIIIYGHDYSKLGNIAPGETKEITFSFAVNQRYVGKDELPVHFSIKEERPKFSNTSNIKLALNTDAPEIKQVTIESKETHRLAIKNIVDESTPPDLDLSEKVFNDSDIAVVIGIENYRDKNIPKSDFSYNDAKAVKQYLEAMGFAARNIDYLYNENATFSDIQKELETKLKNKARKNSRIIVYYSGHGAPEPNTGESYLVPYDGDPNYLTNTGYSLNRIKEGLGNLDVKEVVLIMDSCFSGAGGRSVLASNVRPLVMVKEGNVLSDKLAVLSSTQRGQITSSSKETKHGIFTYYFLQAIKNGKKDLAEVFEYVKPRVEDEAKRQNVEQSPSLSPIPSMLKGRFLLRN